MKKTKKIALKIKSTNGKQSPRGSTRSVKTSLNQKKADPPQSRQGLKLTTKTARRTAETLPEISERLQIQRKSSRKSPAKLKISRKSFLHPKTSKQFLSLGNSQQEIWNRTVHVVTKMRTEDISLAQAARELDIDARVVRARAGSALRKTKSGRVIARRSDKLLRALIIPSPDGLKEIFVRDSTTASKIAEYSDAVQTYLRTGNSSKLKKFRRIKLLDEKGQRIKLLTDLADLQKLGSAGVLSFESLYARVA